MLWGESVVIHPNSHSECTTFSFPPQHLHHSQTEAEAFISIHHCRRHGDLITSLVHFIYLFLELLASSPNPPHLVPRLGTTPIASWWNQVSISFFFFFPSFLRVNSQLIESRERKRSSFISATDWNHWSWSVKAVQWSVTSPTFYLLLHMPKSTFTFYITERGVRGTHSDWHTHSHTCTDCECNPLTELVSFHSAFHRKLPS